MADMPPYMPRLVDARLREILSGLPSVMLVGPRACGKSTTASRLVSAQVRLDSPRENAAFRADPDAALAELRTPVLLDEWQEVPGVLGAVKRAVDQAPGAGRFVLTGSVRDGGADSWPATGRVVTVTMLPMTRREVVAGDLSKTFVERVRRDAQPLAEWSQSHDSVVDYIQYALAGGLPEAALHLDGKARRAWLRGYVSNLASADVRLAGAAPDPERFQSYLQAVAAQSAGVVAEATLLDAARISRPTAGSYERLLASLFFSQRVPAYWADRLTRLTALPKRYLLDTAILAATLEVDAARVLGDTNLLGRFLDTFVACQLRPELSLSDPPVSMLHCRTKGGEHEVDIVLEYPDGSVVGIEVKATASPSFADARHLAWLRDSLGGLFAAGVVFHTGPRGFRLGDRIVALPISALWS